MTTSRIKFRRKGLLELPGTPDSNIVGAGVPGLGSPPAAPIAPPGDTAPGVDIDTSSAPNGMGAGWWTWIRSLLATTSIRSISLPPWYLQPIPGSIQFQKGGTVTVTGTGTTVIPNSKLKLPTKNAASIATVSIFMAGTGGGSLAATNFATFAIRIDGTPVPGWTQRFTFPRVAISVQEPFDGPIIVPPGRTIDAVATDTDGGTYVVGLFYTGWHTSEAAIKRYNAGLGTSGV